MAAFLEGDGVPDPVAPIDAGPPPLSDVMSFSQWVTRVFGEEHETAVLDKLSAMDAEDDMGKMRLLLGEEANVRRSRAGEPVLRSYDAPEEGAGSRDVMVIGFGGENDKLGGTCETGGLKPEGFMKLCKKSGVRWALFASDPTHCWYHRGLAAGDGDGFNSLISLLQAEIDLVQPREIVMIGASMGGYAAIRAGLALKAKVVLAYSPQVLLGSMQRASAGAPPLPWLDPYLLKLQLTSELEAFKLGSLIEALETTPSTECYVQVHTGLLDVECETELEMLRRAAARKGYGAMSGAHHKQDVGVKVSIRAHAFDDPLTEMKASGELQALLKGYCGLSSSRRGPGSSRSPTKKKQSLQAINGRSAQWFSSSGRQEAAANAGLTDLSGPVVRASDGRGFDAQLDARPAPGESESQFKAMLGLWERVDASDLPGFFFWHKLAFDLTHSHLIELATIFYEYCKKGAAVGGAGKDASDGFTMSQREWVAMCKEAKVPVPIGEINDAHRRCDRPTKEEKEAALATKGGKAAADKQLSFPEFVEALLRLAVKLLATTSAGRNALKAGNGGDGFKRLINKYLLPLKEKDVMAEARAAAESSEVNGVLKAFNAPLEKQFNAIAKRKTKILAAKAATGAATRADGTALNEPLTVTIEDFCKDLERQKLFCDLKEVVLDPIRGNPDINVAYELSRLDAERCFVEAQDRDQAILGMLTGDEAILSSTSLLDYDEYLKLIAFCGLNMFRSIERLPPHEKVEVFVRTMTAAVPELDYRDYVIRDRLNHAVKHSFSKGLVRFDAKKDLATADEKAVLAIPDWHSMWVKMDLSDVHGWPLWEKEVFLILGNAFEELSSIFSYYAKSGGVGTSAESAFVLQQAEVTNFSLDCGLATKEFMMARIHNLMEQSDQSDATKVMHQRFQGDQAYDKRRKGGNNTLELFEFCELIVRIGEPRLLRDAPLFRSHLLPIVLAPWLPLPSHLLISLCDRSPPASPHPSHTSLLPR